MIPLSAVLFVAGATEPPALPALSIDPCVEVDAEEVRRLAEIELGTGHRVPSPTELEVSVSCQGGLEELKLTDRGTGRVTVRSIDLSAPRSTDRDAKARELALAIAELLRRAATESVPEPPPPPPPEPPAPATPAPPPAPPQPRKPRWDVELGAGFSGVGWSGGERWFGPDVSGRLHLGRWLIAELAIGGRKASAVDLTSGTLDGYGISGRVGLAVDVTPGIHRVGVSLGASLGGDWMRYTAVDGGGREYGGGDAGALSAVGTTTAFVVLSGPLCITFRAAIGGALHSILIEDNGQPVSGAHGVLVSGTLGLATQF